MLFARVASLSLLAFLLIGSYAIARPTIDSLFLQHYSATQLPYAWIATAAFTAIVMVIYNRFNLRHSLLKLFGFACIASGVLLVVCMKAYQLGFEHSIAFLYVWKEIYIVVLIEIFWSFADVVFSIKNARWTYGLLLGSGSVGGLVGNYFVGDLASLVGTVNAVWWVLPILMLCWLISVLFSGAAGDKVPSRLAKQPHHWFESFTVVKNSRYLVPLLFLVAVIQVATTLIDYEFNTIVQKEFLDIDARTDIMGKTHALIDLIAVVLQILTAPVLRLLGVASTLLVIPFLISVSVVSFMVLPNLAMILITKISSKCFDYSLFRAAKEILYIPLNHREKTQGKGLIDILVYRISKGASSLLILGLIYLNSVSLTMQFTLAFLLIWLFLTYIIVRRYRSIVTLEQEIAGEAPWTKEKERLDL